MTIIELAFFLFNLTCGILLSLFLAKYGFVYSIAGLPLGFVMGIGFFKGVARLLDVWYKGRRGRVPKERDNKK